MSMPFALSVIFILILLVASELWWRMQEVHGEFSRKFVHITVGSFVAFWPYFLTSKQIMLLSVAFLVSVAVSKYFRIFQAIHSVQRPTLGEFWFALVVGMLAFISNHPHVYTAALLVMALADGLAAVVGTRFGQGQRYAVFGSPKSVVGTSVFLATTCLILYGYVAATPGAMALTLILPIAAGATILENVAVFRGLDNLVVPLFIAGALLALA